MAIVVLMGSYHPGIRCSSVLMIMGRLVMVRVIMFMGSVIAAVIVTVIALSTLMAMRMPVLMSVIVGVLMRMGMGMGFVSMGMRMLVFMGVGVGMLMFVFVIAFHISLLECFLFTFPLILRRVAIRQ